MTGTGVAITLVASALALLGVEVPEEGVAAAVGGLVQFFGFVFIVWGQLRRKDLTAGIVRK